jgi:DMSO reductase anchor subunit
LHAELFYQRRSWRAFVGVLAIANMLVHRLVGSSINPPVWTAVLFAIPVAGLAGAEPWSKPWPKRAVYAILAGTILGWLFYAEVVTAF